MRAYDILKFEKNSYFLKAFSLVWMGMQVVGGVDSSGKAVVCEGKREVEE